MDFFQDILDAVENGIDSALRFAGDVLEVVGENIIAPGADLLRSLPRGEEVLDAADAYIEKTIESVEKVELEDIVGHFAGEKTLSVIKVLVGEDNVNSGM